MLTSIRWLLVAILLSWQAFPALTHTDWIHRTATPDPTQLFGDQDDQQKNIVGDDSSDPVEPVSERPLQLPLLLALIPEVQGLVCFDHSDLLVASDSLCANPARDFLFRDRGPPLS